MTIAMDRAGSVAHDESASVQSTALALRFAEIARTLWASRSVVTTLQRIVEDAVGVVDACDAASVSMVHGTAVDTPAWSDAAAADVDTLQYATGEGPCLDAVGRDFLVYAEDLLHDARWPSFGPQAASRGMRSLLSLRLGADVSLGSLNLYARAPAAYALDDRTKAVVFARHAGVAVAAVKEVERLDRELASERKRFQRLQRALRSHGVVAIAEGILMQDGLTAADAFAALRRTASDTGRDIADVAAYVVRRRRLPVAATGRTVA